MGRHDERVRNGHHLILRSTDAGDERCFLNDVARSIVQLDAVTQLERPHVVMTSPAMILPITVLEPSETIKPTNTEIPWKTPDLEPGR